MRHVATLFAIFGLGVGCDLDLSIAVFDGTPHAMMWADPSSGGVGRP